MTHIYCTSCRRRIPYGEPPFTTLRRTTEVCLDCIQKARGRTGSAPGDTEATSQAQVHAEGDSGGGGAEGSRFCTSSPDWFVYMCSGQGFPASG